MINIFQTLCLISERCSILGTELTAEQSPKNITLVDYPERVPRYKGCHWVIQSYWQAAVKLTFHYFDLTPVDNIWFSDSSKTYTSLSDRIFISPKFNGLNQPPSVIYSMSKYLLVYLAGEKFSNPSRNYSGLSFQYSSFTPGKVKISYK